MKDDDDPQCQACGEEYALRSNCEPTAYCDRCAQLLVPVLKTAIANLLAVIATDELIPESVSYMRQARDALAKTEAGMG